MVRLPALPAPTLPRIRGLPDPLRRAEVPDDLDSVLSVGEEGDLRAAGLRRRTVERIWKAAVELYKTGIHPHVALCVRRNGQVVLDRSLGHVRGNGPKDGPEVEKVVATTGTPQCIFSTSKAVTALIVHMLCEQGVLTLEDRVVDHFPEYGRHGKDQITIGHVLSHRAGVPGLPAEAMELETLEDRDRLVHYLVEAKPATAPGSMLAYHAVSGGFILGEVVRRATGRTLREILREEILEPLGFRWGNYGVRPEDVDRVALSYVTGPPMPPPLSTFVTRALGPPLDRVVELSNDPRFLTAIVPSANVVTTANELSRFFEIFRRGGELDGVRVMKRSTLSRALTEQSHLEVDLTMFAPIRHSYGMFLGARFISPFGLDTQEAFGHVGLINTMGWADPARRISVGLLANGKAIVYPEIGRFLGLMQTIAAEVPKA